MSKPVWHKYCTQMNLEHVIHAASQNANPGELLQMDSVSQTVHVRPGHPCRAEQAAQLTIAASCGQQLSKNRWNTRALGLNKKQRWKEQLHFHKNTLNKTTILTCLWSTENYTGEKEQQSSPIGEGVNTRYLKMSTQMEMHWWALCKNVSCRLQLFKMQSTEHCYPDRKSVV